MNLTIVHRIEEKETSGSKASIRGFEMTAYIRANAFRERGTKVDGI